MTCLRVPLWLKSSLLQYLLNKWRNKTNLNETVKTLSNTCQIWRQTIQTNKKVFILTLKQDWHYMPNFIFWTKILIVCYIIKFPECWASNFAKWKSILLCSLTREFSIFCETIWIQRVQIQICKGTFWWFWICLKKPSLLTATLFAHFDVKKT